MDNEKAARAKAQEAEARERTAMGGQRRPVSLKDLRKRAEETDYKTLNVIIKADVHGSLEAVRQSLEGLGKENDEVGLKVVAGAVGNINGSDIEEIVLTDTIPPGDKQQQTGKVRMLSVADLLAEAIRRIHEDESVSSLFV
jgi:translation initiation factor IF-2